MHAATVFNIIIDIQTELLIIIVRESLLKYFPNSHTIMIKYISYKEA